MKKIYSKPDIVFESFSLFTSIAAPCKIRNFNPGQGTCTFLIAGENVFLTSVAACNKPGNLPITVDGSNGICYHVPTAAAALFNS